MYVYLRPTKCLAHSRCVFFTFLKGPRAHLVREGDQRFCGEIAGNTVGPSRRGKKSPNVSTTEPTLKLGAKWE